jgi:hypothetical protein
MGLAIIPQEDDIAKFGYIFMCCQVVKFQPKKD